MQDGNALIPGGNLSIYRAWVRDSALLVVNCFGKGHLEKALVQAANAK